MVVTWTRTNDLRIMSRPTGLILENHQQLASADSGNCGGTETFAGRLYGILTTRKWGRGFYR
jgi:hypothetical protein